MSFLCTCVSRWCVQFLCECVRVLLREQTGTKISPTWTSVALKELRKTMPSASLSHLELAELDNFVFLLADLWDLDADGIRKYWVSNLFAAGKEAYGKAVSESLYSKNRQYTQPCIYTPSYFWPLMTRQRSLMSFCLWLVSLLIT